jgi:hypothetical protein
LRRTSSSSTPLPSSVTSSTTVPATERAVTRTTASAGFPAAPAAGSSQPWSTALTTRCLSASATPSSTCLSISTSSPAVSSRTARSPARATSRTMRGSVAKVRRTGTMASPIVPSRTSAMPPR